jgi:GH35 family endo-1,4-beta-xylanase
MLRIQTEGTTVDFTILSIEIAKKTAGEQQPARELLSSSFANLEVNFDDESIGDFNLMNGTASYVSDIARSGKALNVTGRSQVWAEGSKVIELDVTDLINSGKEYVFNAWVYLKDTTYVNLTVGVTDGITAETRYSQFGGTVFTPRPTGEWFQIGGRLPVTGYIGDRVFIYIETGHYQATDDFHTVHPDIWIDDVSFSYINYQYDLTLPSINETYKDKFIVGNIMTPAATDDAATTDMFKYHYGYVTAGNAMKPDALAATEGVYSFADADKLVEWGIDNNIPVYGYVLVWHQQTPTWLNGGVAAPLTRAEAKANLEAYITNVAGHFKGKIKAWDVVNEAFLDGTPEGGYWKDALRSDGGIGQIGEDGGTGGSPWWASYENGADKEAGESGADYIYDAFVFARLADPDATLYFNEYNEYYPAKRDAIVDMTNELNALWLKDPRNTEPERMLIEGIGMQAHYFTENDAGNAALIETAIKAFATTGAVISVTELDVVIGAYDSYRENTGDFTAEQLATQTRFYAELFDIYSRYHEYIDHITIWGRSDADSWRGQGDPLLFDREFFAKKTYQAVINPDDYLTDDPS